MDPRVLDKAFEIRVKEGRLAQVRFLCAALVKRRHPRAAARVLPAIGACSDIVRLQMWMLEANDASSAQLVRVFSRSATARSGGRRPPRLVAPRGRPRRAGLRRGVGVETRRAGSFTAEQLARVIPQEIVVSSTLYDQVREKAHETGFAQGFRKGRLDDARLLCASFVKRYHSRVAARVLPAIEACTNVARLHRWTLRAPEVSSQELVRLVGHTGAVRVTDRRTPRPARRARGTSAR
jgi:hypothetical protein